MKSVNRITISYDHTSLIRKVCEHQFFGLDPIFEPISTLPLESRLDLSQIPKSVLIFIPILFESKSIMLAQRPITLVLMMIKSCSIVLMIFCLFSLRYLIKILVGV